MSKMTNPTGEPSVSCGFFNSNAHDRRYDALQMSSIFDGIINDGIFASIGTCFVVNATDTNVVNVGPGKAWFNHTWTTNDAVLPIDCGISDALHDRYDAIVIEVNHLNNVRDNFIKVIKGEPGSQAQHPPLSNGNGIFQHVLCYIKRPAGSTKITQAEIINMIGTPDTPFITGLLRVTDLDSLLGQWRSQLDQFVTNKSAEFNTWFEDIKKVLTTDGSNAVTLGGRKKEEFMFHNYSNALTAEIINNPCYQYAYTGDFLDTTNIIGLGANRWYHVIYNPHLNYSAGYGGQILIPFSDNRIIIRTANGTKWTPGYDYKTEIENVKQSAVDMKTNVANAINGKLGTALGINSTGAEMARYINTLMASRPFKNYENFGCNLDSSSGNWWSLSDTMVAIVQVTVSDSSNPVVLYVKADKPVRAIRIVGGFLVEDIEVGTNGHFEAWSSAPLGITSYMLISQEPCTMQAMKSSDKGLLTFRPFI